MVQSFWKLEVQYSKLLPEIPKLKEPEGKEEIMTEKARVACRIKRFA
jgi:hypothetical protein